MKVDFLKISIIFSIVLIVFMMDVFSESALQSASICVEDSAILQKYATHDTSEDFEVDKYGVLTAYMGSDTDVIVPESVRGIPVTQLGSTVFSGNNELTSVILPEGLMTISERAFFRCSSLKRVTIPNTIICIESFAFSHCESLQDIVIPESVERIGNSVFSGCVLLTNVEIGCNVSEIGVSWFSDCKSLIQVTLPESIIQIGANAFSECSSLRRISIPIGVQKIGGNAFFGCNKLTEITIPDNVMSIGFNAFGSCNSLRKMSIPFVGGSETNNRYLGYIFGAEVYSSNSRYVPETLENIAVTKSLNIGQWAFSGCSSLKEVNILSKAIEIGAYAFSDCNSLKRIMIPDSLTSIGSYAFSGDSALTAMRLPISVQRIGNYVFHGCDQLSYLVVGEHVTSIENWDLPSSLRYIEIPNSVRSIDFLPLETIIFCYPNSYVKRWAEENGREDYIRFLNELEFTQDVDLIIVDIDRILLNEMVSLSVYIVPSVLATELQFESSAPNVIFIDSYGNLKGISVGKTVITISCGDMVKTLDIVCQLPDNTVCIQHELGDYVVENRKEPTCVEVGSYDIVGHCIYCAVELSRETAEIPAVGHTEIIDPAIPATFDVCGYTGGSHCGVCGTVIVERTVIPVYTESSVVDLPESSVYIETEAFEGSAVVAVRLAEECKIIGSRAFANCLGLKIIYIPASVTVIADDAFEGCTDFTIVTAADSIASRWAVAHGIAYVI